MALQSEFALLQPASGNLVSWFERTKWIYACSDALYKQYLVLLRAELSKNLGAALRHGEQGIIVFQDSHLISALLDVFYSGQKKLGDS